MRSVVVATITFVFVCIACVASYGAGAPALPEDEISNMIKLQKEYTRLQNLLKMKLELGQMLFRLYQMERKMGFTVDEFVQSGGDLDTQQIMNERMFKQIEQWSKFMSKPSVHTGVHGSTGMTGVSASSTVEATRQGITRLVNKAVQPSSNKKVAQKKEKQECVCPEVAVIGKGVDLNVYYKGGILNKGDRVGCCTLVDVKVEGSRAVVYWKKATGQREVKNVGL